MLMKVVVVAVLVSGGDLVELLQKQRARGHERKRDKTKKVTKKYNANGALEKKPNENPHPTLKRHRKTQLWHLDYKKR